MKFNDIKKVYDFIINEIGGTKGSDLLFTPKVCIVEDEVYFELFQKHSRIIEEYYVAIRKTKSENTVILDKISKVEIEEFEDFTVIMDNSNFTVFIINNYDKESKNYLKYMTLKGI